VNRAGVAVSRASRSCCLDVDAEAQGRFCARPTTCVPPSLGSGRDPSRDWNRGTIGQSRQGEGSVVVTLALNGTVGLKWTAAEPEVLHILALYTAMS